MSYVGHMTARIEIRTSDIEWAATRPAGRDGRVIANVTITDEHTIGYTGKRMVTYTYIGEHPADVTAHGFAPVDWIV